MARIDLMREHHLPPARARQLLEALAAELTQQFGATYAWAEAGKRMIFEKDGISGMVELKPQAVHITSDLGFLLSPLKPTIERQLNVFMDELLAKEAHKNAPAKNPAHKAVAARKTAQPRKTGTGKRADRAVLA